MTSRKTDGQRLARLAIYNWFGEKWIVERIDRLIRRRMAEAWEAGNELPFVWGNAKANPYRGRKKK